MGTVEDKWGQATYRSDFCQILVGTVIATAFYVSAIAPEKPEAGWRSCSRELRKIF